MLFTNIDFNFAHFNFAHFKIEESFTLIWVKLRNRRFHLKFPFTVFKRCLLQVLGLILLILCNKGSLGQIWVKITE